MAVIESHSLQIATAAAPENELFTQPALIGAEGEQWSGNDAKYREGTMKENGGSVGTSSTTFGYSVSNTRRQRKADS